MKLDCPKCATKISEQDMNMERMVAKCTKCDWAFSFANEFSTISATPQAIKTPKPNNMQVFEKNGKLLMIWPWFDKSFALLTFLAVIWNVASLTIIGSGLFAVIQGNISGLLYLLLPNIWIGLGLIYYVLCGYINKTSVFIDDNTLTVEHGPLPLWGKKTLAIDDITHVHTKRLEHAKYEHAHLYSVYVNMLKDENVKLVSGLTNAEQASFIKQKIRYYLGINRSHI